jgi:hypothetical protein
MFEFCEDDDVAYGRLDALPPPSDASVVAAVMHVLVYGPTARGPLGPSDFVVANWGLHGLSSAAAWPQVLQWWKGQIALGRAPRLIHRETSPSHWPGQEPHWQRGTRTCAKQARSCHPHVYPRDLFYKALKQNGMRVDDRTISVLPISEPTLSRADEHGMYRYWQGPIAIKNAWIAKQGGWYLADCVHFCLQSSTFRFWSAALLAVLEGMASGDGSKTTPTDTTK